MAHVSARRHLRAPGISLSEHALRRKGNLKLRPAAIVAGALFFVAFLAGEAEAHEGSTDPFGSGSLKTDISAGNTAIDVGDAWFNRSLVDGDDTLRIHIHVPAGIDEDSVCLSATAFTDRAAPGSCDYKHDLSGETQDDYTIVLPDSFEGDDVFAQVHVTVQDGETAFAGWESGKPFFGNVRIQGEEPPPPPAEVCDDGVDNDGDGQTDEGCDETPPTEVCDDGVDNDGDGQTDEGCDETPPTEVCDDGVDNDGDGQVDEGCDETPPTEVCDDGVDNNGNGQIDEGCGEPPQPPVEVCDDGVDNDDDGQIDEGCEQTPPPVEVCDDGVDNDGDGQVDEGCVAVNPDTDTDADEGGTPGARVRGVITRRGGVEAEGLARTGRDLGRIELTALMFSMMGLALMFVGRRRPARRFQRRQ